MVSRTVDALRTWLTCEIQIIILGVLARLTESETINRCTSMPAVALELYLGKEPKPNTVSQTLTVQYLGPSKSYASRYPTGMEAHSSLVVIDFAW